MKVSYSSGDIKNYPLLLSFSHYWPIVLGIKWSHLVAVVWNKELLSLRKNIVTSRNRFTDTWSEGSFCQGCICETISESGKKGITKEKHFRVWGNELTLCWHFCWEKKSLKMRKNLLLRSHSNNTQHFKAQRSVQNSNKAHVVWVGLKSNPLPLIFSL